MELPTDHQVHQPTVDQPLYAPFWQRRLHQGDAEQRGAVPTLAKGDVVILDNLGSHKGQAIRRAIRAAGAHLIFLSPYSPDSIH
ncbi:hypothetical protein CO665_05555 [Rhizobium anhuiense]|nr:hypothetical protein CO665_05555 [Rhizobium anhuiense]